MNEARIGRWVNGVENSSPPGKPRRIRLMAEASDAPVRSFEKKTLREAKGSPSCVLISCPEAFSPTTSCPITTGKPCKLSQLQGDDPLILTLARGHYCPKEHQQHLELAAFYPKIAVAYTQIATIATDDHHTLQEFRASVGAQWPFLSDPGRTIQKDLDIAEYTDPENNPMIPHTLVLKPGLVIYSIYNGYWFWGRPSVIDLWHDLRIVTSEIRPDWDLSTPGLREAWNAGDFSRFHGWNKQASEKRARLHGRNSPSTKEKQHPEGRQ